MIIKKQLSSEFSKQLFNDFANNLAFRAFGEILSLKEREDSDFDREEYLREFVAEWIKASSENTTMQINGLGLDELPEEVHIEDVISQGSKSIREVAEFIKEILGLENNE